MENTVTNLIGPDALEADAVVPQCLDNQFVSDTVFEKMIAGSLDYTDKTIYDLREKEVKREFIRSLIYSSQVVIQRAFLTNSDFIFKNFLPEENKNFNAFASLVRDRVIVPFLFTEKSLRDNLNMETDAIGKRAVHALLDELGDKITCVRLAVNDVDCAEQCAAMATDFGSGLTRLNFLGTEQRNAVASELFLDPSRLQEAGAFEAFNSAIDDLVDYAVKKAREKRQDDKHLARSDVYRDNFMADVPEAVVKGRFKRPSDKSFLFQLKKYVDLVYNTNLPDRLKRYTFTPENMPSRMTLQDAPASRYRPDEMNDMLADKEAIEYARRAFMAHSQRPMSLPLLSDLSVADVQDIRKLPEWTVFKDSQTQILKNPLAFLNKIQGFEEDFDRFQRALSKWYHSNYARAKVEERYCNYVSLALNVAGQIAIAGSDLNNYEKGAARMAVPFIVDNIPKKVKGYAVKLMVNVYDIEQRKLDADRSYSVELMHTNAELFREDVIELVRSISSTSDDALPPAFGHFADQGSL